MLFDEREGFELEAMNDYIFGSAPTLTLPRAKSMHRRGNRSLPPVLFTGGIEGGRSIPRQDAKVAKSLKQMLMGRGFS